MIDELATSLGLRRRTVGPYPIRTSRDQALEPGRVDQVPRTDEQSTVLGELFGDLLGDTLNELVCLPSSTRLVRW